ncbi:dihydrolipoamide dehydrogenase [Mycoplasmoides fastidiosum]|uniref:Dihydrolipoyl dehydrogenase n=1 Tax=Mycoplasmoides fastidiosum TaxID=92758 RepID=A0ABU0LYW9_9BACT|nr:dihydrolipoyl dehydrogenase [Mycoplasmoides fastidiosum]MDQ0513890.1 dihydrolipoamide dehydrogenase [Mycoplasmoides fastidiosum]UUD37696.1 dihydrolipoyl dehydrogenase [Mycoplasmoides fastidiosum]
MKKYDVIVIGAGPGGYTLAVDLAKNNLKVGLIEKNFLGGTCVNYGCIPTKALLSSAKKINNLKHYADYGIDVNVQKIDYTKIQTNRAQLKEKLNGAINATLIGAKVDLFTDEATVIDEHSLQLKSGETLEFDKLVLATGSRSRELDLPGFAAARQAEVLSTSSYFLYYNQPQLFKSLTIIGGGPISVEFAYLYATLGVEVTILQDMPTIIPQFDVSGIKLVDEMLKDMGIKIVTGAKILEMTADFQLIYEHDGHKHQIKTEKYLETVGRIINDESFTNLNLARDQRNRLVLTPDLKTSLAHVYALGDVTAQIQLSNVAYIHSGIIARSILGLKSRPINLSNVPYALYLSPEIASVGASEQFLQKTKKPEEYQVVEIPAAQLPRNHAEQRFSRGFFKLIVDPQTHLILGAHIGLDDASILINELAVAMNNNLTIDDLAATAHTHPTLSEAIYYVTRNLSLQFAQK